MGSGSPCGILHVSYMSYEYLLEFSFFMIFVHIVFADTIHKKSHYVPFLEPFHYFIRFQLRKGLQRPQFFLHDTVRMMSYFCFENSYHDFFTSVCGMEVHISSRTDLQTHRSTFFKYFVRYEFIFVPHTIFPISLCVGNMEYYLHTEYFCH